MIFTDEEQYTLNALNIEREFITAIGAIFDKHRSNGEKIRDLESLATSAVYTVATEALIDRHAPKEESEVAEQENGK